MKQIFVLVIFCFIVTKAFADVTSGTPIYFNTCSGIVNPADSYNVLDQAGNRIEPVSYFYPSNISVRPTHMVDCMGITRAITYQTVEITDCYKVHRGWVTVYPTCSTPNSYNYNVVVEYSLNIVGCLQTSDQNISNTEYAADTDCDGLIDGYDPYPTDPTPFQWRVKTEVTGDDDVVYRMIIETDRGDEFWYGGNVPEGQIPYISIGLDDTFLPSSGLQDVLGARPDMTIDSNPTDTVGLTTVNVGGSVATPVYSGSTGVGDTTDSERLTTIATNTYTANQNAQAVADRLDRVITGIDNVVKATASLNKPNQSVPGDDSSEAVDALRQTVEDAVAGGEVSYDSTNTGSLVAGDYESEGSVMGQRFSDRWIAFKDHIVSTPIFSVPFGIFTGFSGAGGASNVSVSIGRWGGTVDETFDYDLSDYSVVWDVLKTIILLMFSYAAFKIIVVKKA